MLWQPSPYIVVFLIAAVGPCAAEPRDGAFDLRSSPVDQNPTVQINGAPGGALDAHEVARLHPQAGAPGKDLLAAIASWLSAALDMPMMEVQPRVELVSSAALAALRFTGSRPKPLSQVDIENEGRASADPAHDLVALYEDATRTIFLQAGWTGASPAELSVLVHEMVHHLQNLAGLQYECAEARERPAFVAQQQWLELFGQDLESEFSVDPMTLLVRTTCMR